MASYAVNPAAVAHCRELIEAQAVRPRQRLGRACSRTPTAQNAYLERHTGTSTPRWHLGLTEGATDGTKARYAFVYGDFRRVHRTALIACVYRASEWRHKEVELAAHDLLQLLDRASG